MCVVIIDDACRYANAGCTPLLAERFFLLSETKTNCILIRHTDKPCAFEAAGRSKTTDVRENRSHMIRTPRLGRTEIMANTDRMQAVT